MNKKSSSNITIIPTVLANTKEEFDDRLARLLPVSKELQVDFMDGHFVPSTGVALKDIPDLRRWASWTFEAHLMSYHPETWIEDLADKGFKKVIFHFEAVKDNEIEKIATLIRQHHMKPVLAINPETSPTRVIKYAKVVDGILFLGVHPGFNGAPYVQETPSRVAQIITLFKESGIHSPFIQIDGGMKPETIAAVTIAGATRINTGSFVGNALDPTLALKQLYAALPTTQSTTKKNVKSIKKNINKRTTRITTKKSSHTSSQQRRSRGA